MKIIMVDPRPTSQDAMIALLRASAPVYGIEFTLPALAFPNGPDEPGLLVENIDGQHTSHPDWAGMAAIEIAAIMPLPDDGVSVAVVRPDADALGAAALLELRRGGIDLSLESAARVTYIARYDSFQAGVWPGRKDPAHLRDPERVLFAALSAICLDFKTDIVRRVEAMREWILTGDCGGLRDAITKVTLSDAKVAEDVKIIEEDGRIAILSAHIMGATSVGYCYCPVLIILNDAFRLMGGGEHLKYTICQFEPDRYIDLRAVSAALNEVEECGAWSEDRVWVPGTWGGSTSIIGSPQGVSSSLSVEEVRAIVMQFLK